MTGGCPITGIGQKPAASARHTAAELDELILLLKKGMNMTIVVVTHELESAFKIADQISIMSDGEFLVTGGPDDIRVCKNPIVQGLLHRTPRENIVDTDAHLRALVNGETTPGVRPD